MKRDAIIKTLAGLVGQPHRVDLKNYDLLITVEIYKVGFASATASHRRRMLPHVEMLHCDADYQTQNICGVSVVDHRFEELKRYNISEIFDPTPKEEAVKEKDKAEVQVSAAAVETNADEAVPTVAAAATAAEDKSGAAATDEVSVDDDDKVVEGDGGVAARQ